CFALTGEDAGSDASAMTDEGVICHGEWKGERVPGMRLTFNKRYITLGPIATLMGLAFKLRDPDHLLGDEEDLGITVALIPTNVPGIEYGDRHYPASIAFQNGPLRGRDVFVPLDHILGGEKEIGQGWKMLMGALAAGRGISLPSLSTAGVQLAARTTGAYARIRRQFHLPVGKFEGVREALARIAGHAYLLESARRFTMIGLDEGEKPAIVSAIMKYHATTRMREAINDAMDVHGGKTICEGPKNYLGTIYRAIPVGITVEGANILTRSMIIFGQGAIRCHPYLTREMEALANDDRKAGLKEFDEAISGHLGYQFATMGRAFWRALTAGRFAPIPEHARELKPCYRRLARYSAALALLSEAALGMLGGALKRRESLSARLGDVLSELYLLTAVLRRYEDDGRRKEDLPFVRWCFDTGLYEVERKLDETLRNFPGWFVSGMVRFLIFPAGRHRRPPGDKLMNKVAERIQEPGEQRDRLTAGVVVTGRRDDPLAQLDRALSLVVQAEELIERLEKAGSPDLEEAHRQGLLSEAEMRLMKQVHEAVQPVIEVDDFTSDQLTAGGIPEKAVAAAS
ncbi:MAG: acyl-CoA dehydrogenase, partial [bacterium]